MATDVSPGDCFWDLDEPETPLVGNVADGVSRRPGVGAHHPRQRVPLLSDRDDWSCAHVKSKTSCLAPLTLL